MKLRKLEFHFIFDHYFKFKHFHLFFVKVLNIVLVKNRSMPIFYKDKFQSTFI